MVSAPQRAGGLAGAEPRSPPRSRMPSAGQTQSRADQQAEHGHPPPLITVVPGAFPSSGEGSSTRLRCPGLAGAGLLVPAIQQGGNLAEQELVKGVHLAQPSMGGIAVIGGGDPDGCGLEHGLNDCIGRATARWPRPLRTAPTPLPARFPGSGGEVTV